ncbi:MAG: hypothetical protein D3923_11555, partial [Candidatus Electrothrix sp. AR3]|nr:hypothetical protein [Candidatus Electrothrix sp. AR3]
DNADIHSTYNQNFDWYFGTDGNTPSDKVDMITAVIHEIAPSTLKLTRPPTGWLPTLSVASFLLNY